MAAARQLTARLLRLGPALPRALGLPAGLQLVSWLSTNSKPPLDAAELSRQLTARQLWEDELALLREKTSSLPYSRVLDLAQQQ